MPTSLRAPSVRTSSFSINLAFAGFGLLLVAPAPAHANFDWGGDCSSGSGTFSEFVPQGTTTEVGTIPAGKRDVVIGLTSVEDVDIQLIDAATGTQIIAWPNGLLNGWGEACTTWEGVEYCWSGYNGDQSLSGRGNEWIEIHGDTNHELIMRAYGYRAGSSQVDYSYDAVPTCYEVGSGSFDQYIGQSVIESVGEIPMGKVNVTVALNAGGGRDIDVQLVDAIDGTEIVAWPDGLLSGAGAQQITYQGMVISWSGYNGIGGDWGHESIEIDGVVTRPLELRAYGFQSGSAAVDYSWGDGVGATCLGIATLSCATGLWCKDVNTQISDPAGACHTELWCGGDDGAAEDCLNVIHPMVPGFFSCPEFSCSWNGCGAAADPSYHFIGNSPAQCQVIRYFCPPGQSGFANACGCGCRDN